MTNDSNPRQHPNGDSNSDYDLHEPDNPPFDPTVAFYSAQETVKYFIRTASVDSVYGKPVAHGNVIVIPAAEVMSFMGMGFGAGNSNEQEGNIGDESSGGGGGGGGRTFSRPVAAIVVSPDGVSVQPILDPTKIAMAALTAGAFIIAMLLRMIKPREALKDLKQQRDGTSR